MTLKKSKSMPMCQEQKKARALWEKGGIQLDSLDETGREGAVLTLPTYGVLREIQPGILPINIRAIQDLHWAAQLHGEKWVRIAGLCQDE